MYQGQGSSEVKLGGKCKIGISSIITKLLKVIFALQVQNITHILDVSSSRSEDFIGNAMI